MIRAATLTLLLLSSAEAQLIGYNEVAAGVYGQVDPALKPAVMNGTAILGVRWPGPPRKPVYMYVPRHHREGWTTYCYLYDVCHRPVFFVQEDWIRRKHGNHPGHVHWRPYRNVF